MISPFLVASVLSVLFGNVARAVRLDEIQLLGTHNSYHIAPDPELDEVQEIDARLGQLVAANKYTHPPLLEQLTEYNVRSLEFDVYYDPEGARFSFRAARALLGLDGVWDESPVMQEPGFKVMHIDNIDYGTHCKTLKGCLSDLRQWSDENPTHIPLLLRIEMKRQTMIETFEQQDPAAAAATLERLVELNSDNPEYPRDFPRTRGEVNTQLASALLAEIEGELGREKLLVPDDLRGDAEYPRQALSERGPEGFWPDVDAVRGKIILLVTGLGPELVNLYGSGLQGSPAFTRYLFDPTAGAAEVPGDVVFVEHYTAGASRYLTPFIADGFFVMAHADLGGAQARVGDRTTYQEVVAAGPQVILTEHLRPASLEGFRGEYAATLPCGEGAVYCVLPSNSTYVARSEQVELPEVPTRVEPRDAILQRQGVSASAAPARSSCAALMAAALLVALW